MIIEEEAKQDEESELEPVPDRETGSEVNLCTDRFIFAITAHTAYCTPHTPRTQTHRHKDIHIPEFEPDPVLPCSPCRSPCPLCPPCPSCPPYPLSFLFFPFFMSTEPTKNQNVLQILRYRGMLCVTCDVSFLTYVCMYRVCVVPAVFGRITTRFHFIF